MSSSYISWHRELCGFSSSHPLLLASRQTIRTSSVLQQHVSPIFQSDIERQALRCRACPPERTDPEPHRDLRQEGPSVSFLSSERIGENTFPTVPWPCADLVIVILCPSPCPERRWSRQGLKINFLHVELGSVVAKVEDDSL